VQKGAYIRVAQVQQGMYILSRSVVEGVYICIVQSTQAHTYAHVQVVQGMYAQDVSTGSYNSGKVVGL
jgi:hypothetical protein